jgi:hypothetical protein
MEFIAVVLFVVVITAVNIVFSIVLQRWKKALVFVPAFIMGSLSAYLFLSAQRIDDLGAIALVIFGFVFLFSGLITLVVAAMRYRS